MEIDQKTAAALGWPKLKYAWIERERRWLCGAVPAERVLWSEHITDLYVTGTRLRLRETVPLNGDAPTLRLSRKADVSASVRLLTSIYLTPEEFACLSSLQGAILKKTRRHIGQVHGVEMSVDVFGGNLLGLILAEAEFEDMESLKAFPHPDFAIREVTDNSRYSGGQLAAWGLPEET